MRSILLLIYYHYLYQFVNPPQNYLLNKTENDFRELPQKLENREESMGATSEK
jgi:hypothetical protein